jgi:hypothetical protein
MERVELYGSVAPALLLFPVLFLRVARAGRLFLLLEMLFCWWFGQGM